MLRKVPKVELSRVGREKSPKSRLQKTGGKAVHPVPEAKLVGVSEKSIKSRRITKLHIVALGSTKGESDEQKLIKNQNQKCCRLETNWNADYRREAEGGMESSFNFHHRYSAVLALGTLSTPGQRK